MKLRNRVLPINIENHFADVAELILLMTEEDPDKRISLDEVSRYVDNLLDDYQVCLFGSLQHHLLTF